MTQWSTRRWFITGASTGLGRAIAEAVLAAGGQVIATARDPATLDTLVAGSGGRAIAVRLDVTDPAQIADALAAGEAGLGPVDVLVNNAGYGFLGTVEEARDEEIRAQFDVNFFGLAAMTRAVLPGMRARGSGFVINMSSIMGMTAMPSSGWYSASKFALEGLSEGLAAEAAPLGIRVMIVEPGPFRTDFAGRSLRIAADPIPDYAAAVAVREHALQSDDTQPGDPVRGARALLEAVDSPSPPLRLMLGRLAVDMALGIHEGRRDEVTRWRDLAASADFPA